MSEPPFVIPVERLPPGFLEKLDEPAQPVEAKPAATVVLMRGGDKSLEVLLLKRHRSAGFVPGAYVFPGGRVDAADNDERLQRDCAIPTRGNVAAHYWFAAVREVFEETGVLLARTGTGEWAEDTTSNEKMEQLRLKLMADELTLADVVALEKLALVLDEVVYFAHWITPKAEPRRYDTRFFAAALPPGRAIRPDAREMVDAIWLSPREALARFEIAELPMVFPTVRTLQDLSAFASVEQALRELQQQDVPTVLPRIVRTKDGVGIVVD